MAFLSSPKSPSLALPRLLPAGVYPQYPRFIPLLVEPKDSNKGFRYFRFMKTIQTQAILVLLLLSCMRVLAQQSQQEQLIIDSIRITKNWRTKDFIILQELNLKTGTPTTQSAIDTAMIKLWNIGNFSSISYQLDTFPDGRNLLNITAKDALTVVPYLSFNGNKNNFQFSAGVNDNNFLGRNIGLELRGSTGTNSKQITIRTAIPRQLLYRNMALTGSFTYGNGMNYQYAEGQKVQGVGYLKKELSLAISNPWHQDFNYKFSPDLSLQFTRHSTDSSLISPALPQPDAYTVTYLQLGVSESMGYIKRRRHQQDGYHLGLGLTWGMGLTSNSPDYHSLSAAASWHHLFNSLVQLSATFATAYTSANIPPCFSTEMMLKAPMPVKSPEKPTMRRLSEPSLPISTGSGYPWSSPSISTWVMEHQATSSSTIPNRFIRPIPT